MAVTGRPVLRSDVRPDEPLASAAIPVLCGCACLLVAWGFAYLDRRLGRFGVEAALWTCWVALGFGAGAFKLKRDAAGARSFARVFTVIGCVLAVFPGVIMFSLLRWAAFSLLLVTAARAPALRTRRDFHYALAAIVAVALLVATHGNADWTIWFYLGPAFLAVALALAWDYAAGVALGRWRKAGMTLGFLAACLAVSLALFAIAPRPNILGFGFLPPGTDTPGRFRVDPAAADAGGRRGDAASGANGSAAGDGAAGPGDSLLGRAIDRMRDTLREPSLPQWQRGVITGLLAAGEAIMVARGEGQWVRGRSLTPAERAELATRLAAVLALLQALLLLLLLALLAFVVWRARWRLATAGALWSAGALERWNPSASMRCSAHAARWLLAQRGHPMRPGQSVLDHLASAPALPPLPREWLGRSLGLYCRHRFGGVPAARPDANHMRRAIAASQELLR